MAVAMRDIQALIDKVAAWSLESSDYHGNRQLGDEILLATGWSVERDATFQGGIRWFCGKCPQVSVSEYNRPNPLLSLEDAIGCMPVGAEYRISTLHGRAEVELPLNSLHAFRVVRDDGNVPAAFVEACLRARQSHG